jgi:hypothetical protein
MALREFAVRAEYPCEAALTAAQVTREPDGCSMAMTLQSLIGRSKRAASVIAVAALTSAIGSAGAATAPIYKCVGKDLGLVYTDQPCKGGEVLDVHPGDVDPAAVERLQVARDMLDRSAAARLADERRLAEQAAALATMARRQRDDDRSALDADYSASLSPDDQYLWWYPAAGQMHRPHPPHKPSPHPTAPHGFAPNPPFVVPRS